MYLIDTNIISELMREHPDTSVTAWLSNIREIDLHTSLIVQAEIYLGIELLSDGRKKELLREKAELLFNRRFRNRIIGLSQTTAKTYASLYATLKRQGVTIDFEDAMIAAQALEHDATVVTRNSKHFAPTGAKTLNPFESPTA